VVCGLKSIVYTYDGYGRRISQLAKGGGFGIPEAQYTEYLWDGTNVLCEFYQNNGNPLEYIYGNGQLISRDDLLVLPVSKRLVYQNSHWFHQDGLGSVVNLTDSTGTVKLSYEYDAFGGITKEEGQVGWKKNKYTFTGKPYDTASGMYYFGARWYEPNVGRFITKDPWSKAPDDARILGYEEKILCDLIIKHQNSIPTYILSKGLNEPQSFHRYVYVKNNPVIYIDPFGYSEQEELTVDPELLRLLEIFYGQDFSNVKVVQGGLIIDAVEKTTGHPGITIGNTIYLSEGSTVTRELLAHEFAHVVQWRREGNILFPVAYVYEVRMNGYEDDAFELEARMRAKLFMRSQ